jgi:WD40 repeat protein
MMNNNSSYKNHGTCLPLILALLAALPACGDLDETDANPPSVGALALWDSSHLLALRTYYKDPVLVDVQSGKQTGTLSVDKWYSDIAVIGNGELIGLHNQSIDFYKADGTLDTARSITATQFISMAMSVDRSTLAYAVALDPTNSKLGILDLPSGVARSPVPDVTFNYGLSIARDGKLVAIPQGDVEVVMTHAPWTTSTCVLDLDPRRPGAAFVIAFSPVDDKLAVGKLDGGVNIFDLSHFPDCTLVSSYVSPEDTRPDINHVQYSPDGTVVAIAVEQTAASATGVPIARTGAIRLLAAATGDLVKELPVYQWQKTSDSDYGPQIEDLQWSETGDRLAVATGDGPLQQWDVATGTLLWSAGI